MIVSQLRSFLAYKCISAHCRFKNSYYSFLREVQAFSDMFLCRTKSAACNWNSPSRMLVKLWLKPHALAIHMSVKWILAITTRSYIAPCLDICTCFSCFLTLPELDFSWLNLFRVVVDTATFYEGDFIFTQILASLLHASYNSILLHKRDFDVSK